MRIAKLVEIRIHDHVRKYKFGFATIAKKYYRKFNEVLPGKHFITKKIKYVDQGQY